MRQICSNSGDFRLFGDGLHSDDDLSVGDERKLVAGCHSEEDRERLAMVSHIGLRCLGQALQQPLALVLVAKEGEQDGDHRIGGQRREGLFALLAHYHRRDLLRFLRVLRFDHLIQSVLLIAGAENELALAGA